MGYMNNVLVGRSTYAANRTSEPTNNTIGLTPVQGSINHGRFYEIDLE